MARQKKVLMQEVTREAAEDAFASYNDIVSRLSIVEGKMNVELTKVKSKYEGDISELQERRDYNFEMLQAYAEGNASLFE